MSLTKITHIRYGSKAIEIGFPMYYDSELNQYKVPMKCTECGDDVGCMCYDTLDDAAFNEDSLICNKKRCFVVSCYEMLDEGMEHYIPCVPLNECTQDELDELHNKYIENADFAYITNHGWECMDVMSRPKTEDELSDSEVDKLYDVLMDMDFDSFGDDQTGALCKV